MVGHEERDLLSHSFQMPSNDYLCSKISPSAHSVQYCRCSAACSNAHISSKKNDRFYALMPGTLFSHAELHGPMSQGELAEPGRVCDGMLTAVKSLQPSIELKQTSQCSACSVASVTLVT